jgi:2,4-dienoyl-CoA reductase (NADPH2)
VGAVISSHVPVHVSGRILPHCATIDCDDRIPFWRDVARSVRAAGARYILQLSYSGRQQDVAGVENWESDALRRLPLSSTSRSDSFHGLRGRAMSKADIEQAIGWFVAGARRAREAGTDGVELHACNGYLFSQFLSSAINDRKDEYGGSLRNRARFLLRVIEAIRSEVGPDFFVMAKLSAVDYDNAVFPWRKAGNTLAESVQVSQWVEQAGADAIHVSMGSLFPHPRNPAGPFPFQIGARTYAAMIASGHHTWRNFLCFRYFPFVLRLIWQRTQKFVVKGRAMPHLVEALNAAEARAIKAQVSIPVLCTGGFQSADGISQVLRDGSCDAVTIGRPLLANPDLPALLEAGLTPERPCTYCNKCLAHVLENPLGCYEESRYTGRGGRVAMMKQVMSIFEGEENSAHLEGGGE